MHFRHQRPNTENLLKQLPNKLLIAEFTTPEKLQWNEIEGKIQKLR